MNDWEKVHKRMAEARQEQRREKQKDDRKKIALVAIVVLVVVLGLIAFVQNTEPAVLAVQAPSLAPAPTPPPAVILPFTSTYFEEEFGDPEPMTMNERPRMSDEARARLVLIGRIAEGVRKLGRAKGGGRWWECGKIYTEEEEVIAAIEWAQRIVWLASEYSDTGSGNGYMLNPWEIAGVAVNECGFDRCALGKYPRKWGYQHGTLKRSRLGISHTYEDIEKTLNDPRGATQFNTSGLDGAPLHVLWRCDKGMCRPKFNKEQLPPIPMREVFSLGMGFEYNVREFKKRAIDNQTSTPSLYWKGYKCDWYREKIVNWEKRLGAKKDEI